MLVGLLAFYPWTGHTDASVPRPFNSLDSAVTAGINHRVYPGAVIIVGRSDTILHARGFGRLAWSGGRGSPRPDSTLYDLASLTKVVATTSAAMLLVDRGKLDLDAPVVRYLPRFSRSTQRLITVRMLLDHTSGLRPYVPFFRHAAGHESVVEMVLQEEPLRTPGSSAVYSDINAILLGFIVESITGETLDRFVTREVFSPLGMKQTRFLPPGSWRPRIAAGYMSGRVAVAGVVQDMNSRILGGVAGHAGLFATGSDLARYAQWWLRNGRSDTTTLVSPTTMETFLEHRAEAGTRLLGWDSPDPGLENPGTFGSLLSGDSFGHTGWTGTQIWIDRDKDLFVILLTNRSLNTRVNTSLRQLRTIRGQVADAAVRAARAVCAGQAYTC
ncbi:MAG: serine hydrolase domain-containing protein [Gemmatimonadota bacterium]